MKERDVAFQVTLSDGQDYEIAGKLVFYGSPKHKVLQVLVHGASYDSRYWDVPRIDGQSYSYAEYMARRGYAVLAVDQLGTGASSRPPGDFLTLQETASGLHQVLDALDEPNNPAHVRFHHMVLVGHSNGALTAIYTQAVFGDADGLVVTGWVHGSVPPIDPTEFEPLLANPYVIVPPEIRTSLFYYLPGADPEVVDYDNAELSAPIARAQFADLLDAQFVHPEASQSSGVDVPVLVQVGERDFLMMFAPLAGEVHRYPNSPDLTLQTIEATGHALNTHVSRRDGFQRIDQWIRERY